MLVLALWNFPLWRWLMVGALGLLLLELAVIALLGGGDMAVLILAVIIALPVLGVAIVAIHTVWRVLDPNRLVWLASDSGALIDVIFKTRRRISLANHGRAFKATSAPALRDSVAEWVVVLEGYELDIRAQNQKVAELYIEQFPQLRIEGADWMGHPRLGIRGVPKAPSLDVPGAHQHLSQETTCAVRSARGELR